MLPFVGIEIYFLDYSRNKGDIASCNDPHWPRRFVLSTNQFCRKGKLSSVNRMYFWMFKRWYVCQYNQMYCTWCYYIIIKLGPSWLDLITKRVPHLKQSCPLLMFQNLRGCLSKARFLVEMGIKWDQTWSIWFWIYPIQFLLQLLWKQEVLDELQWWLSYVKKYEINFSQLSSCQTANLGIVYIFCNV